MFSPPDANGSSAAIISTMEVYKSRSLLDESVPAKRIHEDSVASLETESVMVVEVRK
jgi:hypothetical protein